MLSSFYPSFLNNLSDTQLEYTLHIVMQTLFIYLMMEGRHKYAGEPPRHCVEPWKQISSEEDFYQDNLMI